MSWRNLVIAGAALGLLSSAALAFQEQSGGTGQPAAETPAPEAGVNTTPSGGSPAAKQEGTEVAIPGLGKLGVLPKMDFGLELLYGANDQVKSERPVTPERLPGDDDLTIRGSIKKNF